MPLWPRFERWRADRALRRAVPLNDQARIEWALKHASETAQLQYQGALYRHAAATNSAFLPAWMARQQLQAGIAVPERTSTEWPAYGALGRGRYPGMTSVPKPTPINLRRFSEQPPARRCINKIKGAITRLEFQVKPVDRKLLDKKGNRLRALPIDLQGRIDAAERAFATPDPKSGLSWRTWLELVVEDILVGGFGAVEVRPWESNPLQPFVLYPMDGMSVRINLDWDGDDSLEPDRGYRYCQAPLLGGTVSTTMPYSYFRDIDLMYLRDTPRTFTPFGLGRLEVAFEMVNAWIGAMESRERMESNDIPRFGLDLGEDATPTKVDAFRFYWQNQIEGFGAIPILGGTKGAKVIEFYQRQLGEQLNAWPEFIDKMIAIAFGLSAQSVGDQKNVNRSTGEVMQADEFTDAVLPLTHAVEDQLTSHVLHRLLGWHDLQGAFVITEGDRAKEVAIARELFDGDLVTLNEGREHAGIDPFPTEDPRGEMTVTEYRAWAQQRQAPEEPFGMAPSNRAGLEEQGKPPKLNPLVKPPSLPGFQQGKPARELNAEDAALVDLERTIRAELAGRAPEDRYVSLVLHDRGVADHVKNNLH